MTFDEAVATLRTLTQVHPDGTSWSKADEELTVDYHAPTEDQQEAISMALFELDTVASIVLAVLERRDRPWEAMSASLVRERAYLYDQLAVHDPAYAATKAAIERTLTDPEQMAWLREQEAKLNQRKAEGGT